MPERERILSSATRIFAERGFDGASIGKIVEKAEVCPAMNSCCLGYKDGLIRESTFDRVSHHFANFSSLSSTSSSSQSATKFTFKRSAFLHGNQPINVHASEVSIERRQSSKTIGKFVTAWSQEFLPNYRSE